MKDTTYRIIFISCIILMIICTILKMTYAYELFTTTINITSFSNGSFSIAGEESFYYSNYTANVTNTTTSSTVSKDIFLYRTTDCTKGLAGLNSSYNGLNISYANLYNLCSTEISNISSRLENINYYQQYANSYFMLLSTNESLQLCRTEKDTLNSQCTACYSERETCNQQLNAYITQYQICSANITSCARDLEKSKSKFIYGLIIGAIAGAAIFYFYNEKKKPEGKSPVKSEEPMTL